MVGRVGVWWQPLDRWFNMVDSRTSGLPCLRSIHSLLPLASTNLLTFRVLDVYNMSIYDDTALIAYITFRQSTQLNHHRVGIDVPDYETLLPRTMKFVRQDLPTSVLSVSDDPKFLLELGVRYLFS